MRRRSPPTASPSTTRPCATASRARPCVIPRSSVKLRFLHLADQLGVGSIDLGLPGAGPRAVDACGRLAEEIRDQRLGIKALCAARTLEVDIRPVVEISQRVGIPIEVAAFIGSSPIRQYAEGWTIEQMVDNTRKAVRFARENQLPVMFVTEDTTRGASGHAAPALRYRDRGGRAARRRLRHRRPFDARWRPRHRQACPRACSTR